MPDGGAADVDAAVTAAQSALRGPWSQLSPTQRGTMIHRLAMRWPTGQAAGGPRGRDTGRILRRHAPAEVAPGRQTGSISSPAVDRLVGQAMELGPGMSGYTIHEPVGVVGALIPSNSPLNLCCWKLGPALAAGNAIIIKPSEVAGLASLSWHAWLTRWTFPLA